MRTHLDLFSGIGGFALAARWNGLETIGFSEIDPYCCRVLAKHWPAVPNFGDVRTVHAVQCDLLTGGPPCQPASCAGKRRGAADDRWLWPQTLAVVDRCRPAWCLFENPPGILSLGAGVEFERVLAALESFGYSVQPLVIPACSVDAPHRRDRVWIVAHTTGTQRARSTWEILPSQWGTSLRFSVESEAVAHAAQQHRAIERRAPPQSGRVSQWLPEPDVGRVASRVPSRVDRLRGLGNAIVWQVAAEIIRCIVETERSMKCH